MANDDITLKYGSGFLTSYLLTQNPWPFSMTKKYYDDFNRTSNASAVSYRRGKKWIINMQFRLVDATMRTNLLAVKEAGNPIQIILAVGFQNAGTYTCNWINDFDFNYQAPFQGSPYTGTIILEEI